MSADMIDIYNFYEACWCCREYNHLSGKFDLDARIIALTCSSCTDTKVRELPLKLKLHKYCHRKNTVCIECGKLDLAYWLRSVRKVDWLAKDRSYWKEIAEEAINQTFVPTGTFDIGKLKNDTDHYKAIKIIRYFEREKLKPRKGECPVKDYGLVIGSWLNGQLDKLTKDLNYANARRFAALDSPSAKKRFKKRRTCCGSEEKIVSFPLTGRKFWIGCNYGH